MKGILYYLRNLSFFNLLGYLILFIVIYLIINNLLLGIEQPIYIVLVIVLAVYLISIPPSPGWYGSLPSHLRTLGKASVNQLEKIRVRLDVPPEIFGKLVGCTPWATAKTAKHNYEFSKKQNPNYPENLRCRDIASSIFFNRIKAYQSPEPEFQIPELAMSNQEIVQISREINTLNELIQFIYKRDGAIIGDLASSGSRNAEIVKQIDEVLRPK